MTKVNQNKEHPRMEGMVRNETFGPDGKLATQIIDSLYGGMWLIQYDSDGHVLFKEKMTGISEKDITYHNGRVASIKHRNVITQYDSNCNIVSQITIDKDDVVTFCNGYIQSVTQPRNNSIQEIVFDDISLSTSEIKQINKTITNYVLW